MPESAHINSSELFEMIGRGDEQAFALLYDRYWESLFLQACKRINDPDKCRDLVQNVFMDIWNRRSTLQVEQPEAFLRTAIKFQVFKEAGKKASYFSEIFEEQLISGLRADDVVMDRETAHLIRLFVAALPRKRRQIFELYYFEAQSTAQIADQLGLTRKTVQNQLRTASSALRLRLQHFLSISAFLGCFLK